MTANTRFYNGNPIWASAHARALVVPGLLADMRVS
jgi:hypothetical protein